MAKTNQLTEKLTVDECRFIFSLIEHKYAGDIDAEWEGMKVCQFQAKLSILLECARRRENK